MIYRLNYGERDKMLREGKREEKKRKGKGRHVKEVRKGHLQAFSSVSLVAPLKYCVIYHHIRIHVYFAQVLLVQQPLHSSLYSLSVSKNPFILVSAAYGISSRVCSSGLSGLSASLKNQLSEKNEGS